MKYIYKEWYPTNMAFKFAVWAFGKPYKNLATACGVQPSYLYKILNKSQKVRLDDPRIKKLSEALDISVWNLLEMPESRRKELEASSSTNNNI